VPVPDGSQKVAAAPSVGKRRHQTDALVEVVGWVSISLGSILLALLVGLVSLEGLFRLAFHKPRAPDQSSR
jgi:hypothetical protein